MGGHYYLLAAVVLLLSAFLCNFAVRKTDAGSAPRFIFEKLLANACLGTALGFIALWLVRMIRGWF